MGFFPFQLWTVQFIGGINFLRNSVELVKMHPEYPKLSGVLAILNAIGLHHEGSMDVRTGSS